MPRQSAVHTLQWILNVLQSTKHSNHRALAEHALLMLRHAGWDAECTVALEYLGYRFVGASTGEVPILFTPPLAVQRHEHVGTVLKDAGPLGTIVDLGCGAGRLLQHLLKLGIGSQLPGLEKLVAVDITWEELRSASKLALQALTPGGPEFFLGTTCQGLDSHFSGTPNFLQGVSSQKLYGLSRPRRTNECTSDLRLSTIPSASPLCRAVALLH